MGNSVEANAYYKSKPIQQEFPVIIFSHGLGGNRTQNTANIESLASNGYVVFAIEHTYDANITIFNDSTYIEFDSYLPDGVSATDYFRFKDVIQLMLVGGFVFFTLSLIWRAFKPSSLKLPRTSVRRRKGEQVSKWKQTLLIPFVKP